MNLAGIRKALEQLESAPIRERRTFTQPELARFVAGILEKRKLFGRPGFAVPPLTAEELRVCTIVDDLRARRELL